MKAVIRIKGKVNVPKKVNETLNRMRLRKKFACVVLKPTPENLGMIKKVSNFVAFGDIDKETFIRLVEKRGKKIDKNKKIGDIGEFFNGNKKLEELNIKPFFRLHPARGGMDTKQGYPKGILGNNKSDINKLIERML